MHSGDGFRSRSVEIICGLQEEDGGILATPRDDAYPFVYPRDASFMAMALNMNGMSDRSERFFRFIAKVRRPNGEIFQRYSKGLPYVTQKGEADVAPIVIQGIHDTYLASKDFAFLREMWDLTTEAVGSVLYNIDPAADLLYTNHSIHENDTLEAGYEIWANSAAVKGLLDASKMAKLLGHDDSARSWLMRARVLWKRVLTELFDRQSGLFIKNVKKDGTRINAPDVSQISPFYFGLCNDDRILRTTLEHLRETLWNGAVGGVNRFRDFDVVKDWHWYTGGTGASWPLFTLWLAKFYGKLGDIESAEECLRFVKSASSKEMEIPEKVAPLKGYQEWKENEMVYNERVQRAVAKADVSAISIPGYIAWACPLGWSHAEFIMLGRKDGSAEDSELLADVQPQDIAGKSGT